MNATAHAHQPMFEPGWIDPAIDESVLDDPASPPPLRLVRYEDVPVDRYVSHVPGGPSVGMIIRSAAVVATIVAVFFMLFSSNVAADEVAPPTVSYVVVSGDTLWSLASDRTPADGDIRASIQLIRDVNGMTSSLLVAGDQIQLPALP